MSDISTTSWSELDASNSQQPPEGWPAGMNANAVEPSARMNMGAVKRFWNRINPTYLAALSTTDTFTLTPTQAFAGYGLQERLRIRFPSANTATSPTINISSLGPQLIRKYNGAGAVANLAAGDIQGQDHEMWWDGIQMVLTNPVLSLNSGTVTSVGLNSDTTQGLLVSGSPITTSGIFGAAIAPSRLLTKTLTSSDSVVAMDAAASNAPKTGLISTILAMIAQPFTKTPFVSAQQTITVGGQLILAHGLGTRPLIVSCELVCQTGELGYSINDVLLITNGQNDPSSHGISVVVDATNITIRYGSSVGAFQIIRKDTGDSGVITAANWKLVARGFA